MRFGSFLFATLLVLTGVAIFMLNLGYGSWELIRRAAEMWPVLLILLGLSLFWGGRIPQWLAILLVLALTAGVVYMFIQTPGGTLANTFDKRITVERSEYPGLTRAEADITFGGGRLLLGTGTDKWLEGRFSGRGANSHLEVQDWRLKATLRPPRKTIEFGTYSENNWDIRLSPDLKWDVRINTGGLEGELDLVSLPLESLDLKLGAGDVNLLLGGNGAYTRVKADAGAASFTVQVTEDTGVAVRFDGTLTDTNLQELGWRVVNGRYISPNYEEAKSKIDLDLDMAVGEFKLEAPRAMPVAS